MCTEWKAQSGKFSIDKLFLKFQIIIIIYFYIITLSLIQINNFKALCSKTAALNDHGEAGNYKSIQYKRTE